MLTPTMINYLKDYTKTDQRYEYMLSIAMFYKETLLKMYKNITNPTVSK